MTTKVIRLLLALTTLVVAVGCIGCADDSGNGTIKTMENPYKKAEEARKNGANTAPPGTAGAPNKEAPATGK